MPKKKTKKNLFNFKLPEKDRRLFRILKFVVKFNVFAIPLYIILVMGWTLPALQKLVADFVFSSLTATGYNPAIDGLLISIPINNGNWAAVISWDCVGWKSMLALFALVMATDFGAKRKLLGLVLVPIVFVINLLRILFMFFWVKTFDLAYYQTVHAVVWGWGLILTILVLWFVWMKYDFGKVLGKGKNIFAFL